eukprot:3027228-Rhodomonas_salina.3
MTMNLSACALCRTSVPSTQYHARRSTLPEPVQTSRTHAPASEPYAAATRCPVLVCARVIHQEHIGAYTKRIGHLISDD